MRKFLLVVLSVVVLLLSVALLAETKPKLAVMEIDSDCRKLSKQAIDKATRYLRSRIEVAGKYIVIDKARQDKALTQQMQQESYGACVDESCQIELGRSLAADTILRSKVTEFAGECTLTATLVNLEQQAAIGGAEANFDCSVKGLRVAIDSVIAQLTGKAPAPAPSPTPTPQPDGDSGGLSYEQLMQRAEKLKAEQAAIEAARQKRLKKLEADWKKVQDIARTDLPKKERIAFVKQFLARYPSDNPHQADAERLMGQIEKGRVAAGFGPFGIEWIYSQPTKLHFMKTEATLGQFKACVKAAACKEKNRSTKSDSKYCNWGYSDRDDHPMNCVDWYGAKDFCEWVGGRLPTKEEWYAEASSGGSREYPWGNQTVTCDYAIWGDENRTDGCGKDSTWPVCSKPRGNSISGLCDMSGNVWEWTSSSEESARVLRGGACSSSNPRYLRVSYRDRGNPDGRSPSVGFRCVSSSP